MPQNEPTHRTRTLPFLVLLQTDFVANQMCVYLYHVTQWYIIYLEVLLLPPLRGGSVDSVIQPSGRVMCVPLVSHTLVYLIPLQPPPLQQQPQQPQQLQQLQLKQPLPYPQPPYPSKPRRPPPHPSQHQLWSIISLQILLLPPLRGSRMTTVTQPSSNLVCVIIYSSTIVYTIPARSITASAPRWRFSS